MNKRLEFHADRLGLVMVDPSQFEIVQRRHGRGNRVCFASGETVTDKRIKARIKALVIPPAWSDVRICVEENGHIQAVGRDEKGRIQYRYHDSWVGVRNAVKTERLLRFGRSLPKLRRRIRKDLRRRELDRQTTSAVAARLIDVAAMRPGHEKYAEDGGRGVASLRKTNLRLGKSRATLRFVGKSSKLNLVEIEDRPLVRSLEKMRAQKGKRLFRYRGEDAKAHDLTATRLNDYLKDAARAKISAKDFRTFHGSAEALRFLIEEVKPAEADTEAKRRRVIAKAMKAVSEMLRNTPAVARASYVHPEIVSAFEEERLPRDLLKGRCRDGLTKAESGLMRFLEETATH
ncbi:DNA topoisomerase IB [Aureimonas ureilytica]|uniref:DNA topoisomerase IB n=1 Tax=Aureimonas ureilytica TaxID=401562 RepID=UPI00035F292E|nr:DNA topoisomerase IB [Aureimonas ureilytica]